MTIIDKIKDLLRMLAENIHKRRKVVLALSCVVVFVTTYMLILPAFTLEKTKAAEQGGIDVPGVTTTAEDVSEEDADANDGQTDAQDVQTESGKTEDGKVENSGSKSKDSGEAKADSAQTADPLTYEDEHYTIAVDDKNSVLPENTEIKVEEIDKNEDAKKYQKHFDDALAAIQEEKDGENVSDLEFARFYDISLVSDGKEVTLGKGDKVSVNIEYDKELRKALGVENKDNIRIIHFAENKNTGKVEAEVLDNKEAKVTAETTEDNLLKEAAFDAESFSVYGLVYVKEAEEEAALAEEKTEETAANSEIDLGTAVVSTVDGSDLPEDVDGHADVVAGKKAIAAVENKVDDIDADKTEYKVFDIALENVDESEYKDGFKVDVTLPEGIQGKDFRLFHIHDGKVEELDVQTNGSKTVDGFTFETENFSQFVLSYTVDFEYTIDGKVFKFSMQGGDSIDLRDVLVALEIVENKSAANEFVEKISDVSFSNPELVEVIKKEKALGIFGSDTWILKSLKAFTSEEKLVITLNDGNQFTIKVTDAQTTTDLNSLLTGISVKVNGSEVQNGQTVTVDKGDKFELHLELSENDFYQFPDDATEMTYQLPEGVTLDTATTYITIDMGIDGKVYRNPVVYDPSTNTIKVKWNTKDPNFSKLISTDNAKIVLDLSGSFNENANHIKWSDDLEINVNHEEHHDADIQKNGQLYLPGAQDNPYGNQPAIKYTVRVTSDGTTTVNVKDEVEGTAVTLDTANWTATSNKGTTITPRFTSKGFTLNNQQMQDGEVIIIEYWGKVDTSGIDNLMDVSYSQTGNKVTLTGENIPEKEKTHYEHVVGQNKMSKSSTNVGSVGEDGKQTVEWKIVANSNPLESIGGSKITDRIAADSRQYMSYSGAGITVVAKRADGTVVSSNTYNWNSSNLTLTDNDQDKHWEFTVPETDEALSYEITYTTEVDTTKHGSGYFSVVNNTEGKPGSSSGSATVGKPDTPTPKPVNYTKTAVDVNEEQIVWNISVNIDAAESGYYNPFVLTEYIPNHAFGNIGYTDDLESIEVIGLNDNEWYSIDYNYTKIDDNAWKSSGDNEKPTEAVLTFYRDGKQGDDVQNKNNQNSKANPGINASTNRTLTVRVVTKNSQEWLDLAAQEGITHQDYLKHQNSAKINDWGTVSAEASPMARVVYKMRDGKVDVKGPEMASVYKKVNTPGNNQGVIVDNEQVQYPAYKFWVLVGGVTKDNLNENNQIVIEDVFDPNFRLMMDNELGKGTRYGYGTSPTSFDAKTPDTASGESFSWTQEDGKATFVITNPKKNGDNYYPYYMVEYWLVPKSAEAYEQIKQLTLQEGGEKLFNNVATSGDESASLEFKYNYNVIDKSAVTEKDENASLIKYTIKINPDKLTLNNGDTMTMTDTYSSNLSVDFGSITVTATDKSGNDRSNEVTWDYRGHVGTFTIPDETYVELHYNARVVGDPGSVQTVTNTAYMEGYSDTVSEDHVVDISGSGTAERVRIRLLKFEADHMEGGLDGAQFRLLDQDMNPVIDKDGNEVTYTTSTGYLNKYGVIHAEGDKLDYTLDADQKYTAKVYRNDLTPAAQAKWDSGEIQSPTDDPDRLPTYGDLSPSGMNRLGITLHGGFAEIYMDQSQQGLALKKERVYYLEEIVAPVSGNTHYEKTNVKYSFLISDQSDYSAPGGVYVYHNNDVMTVRNWPSETPSLEISKTFKGNVDLTDEQKNQVTFTIKKKNLAGAFVDYPIDVWDEASGQVVQKATFSYGDKKDAAGTPLFEDGLLKIENIEAGEYQVVETNATISDSSEVINYKTEYLVDGHKATATDNGVTVEITPEDVRNNAVHDVSITNSYFTNKYQILKYASDTAQVLGGAKFKIVKIDNEGNETLVKDGITTNADGKLDIRWANNTWDPSIELDDKVLYYIVETEAPSGFVLPDNPEKNYFYFSSDPTSSETSNWTPGIKTKANPAANPGGVPEGETAVDLAKGYGSASIPNKRDTSKTYVDVNKKWVNSVGKDVTSTMTDAEAVDVKLYRTTSKLSEGTVITNDDSENARSAAELRTLTIIRGDDTVHKLYALQGDTIQLTAQGSDLSAATLNINPYTAPKNLVNTDSKRSWTFTMPDGDATATLANTSEATGVTANNLTAASRVYVLSASEAKNVNKDSSFNESVTLNASNNWAHTFSDLDVTDTSTGMDYLYYVVEDGAKPETVYEVGAKSITVTNTAPEQLEVNKKWEDADGNSINSEKTDGQITYELYQVENPLAVGPYSGTGNYSVNIENLNTDGAWNHVKPELKGHVDRIKEGSKVKLEINANNASNQDLTGEISISGGTVISDTNDLIDIDMGGWTAKYHKRTIIIDNVSGNIVINGTILTNTKLDLVSTVLEEPTNAQTDWVDLVKNKMGDIVVTHNDATLTKTSDFVNSNFRVTPGAKAWSSLIYNLPSSGVKAGKTVNYTYYVVETAASGFTDETPEPEYQMNGATVEYANAETGDTVVIINKEKEAPKGALKIAKNVTVNGQGTDTDKADGEYSFTVVSGDGVEPSVNKTVVIKVEAGVATEYKIDNGSFQTLPNDKFVIIPDLAPGEYTVTENAPANGTQISKINGTPSTVYYSDVTVTAGDTTAANAAVTFTNDYTPKEFEFTKEWHDSSDQVDTTWKDGVAINVKVQRKIGADGRHEDVGSYTITRISNGFTIDKGNNNDPTLINEPNSFTFKLTDLPKSGTIGSDTGEYIYFATETSAVDGYKDPVYSNPSATTPEHWTPSNEGALNGGKIINKPVESYELPHTGGIGTTIFYILGSILVIGGGIYFISRRRAMK